MNNKKSKLGELMSTVYNEDESSDDEDYVAPNSPSSASSTSSQSNSEASQSIPNQRESQSVDEKCVSSPTEDTSFMPIDTNFRAKTSTPELHICCVCLSDQQSEDDELLECDRCGIWVHEACYGMDPDTDIDSKTSESSSDSTEPWFCNACLLLSHNAWCELCPNRHMGIMKESETGRLVHQICALYTPDVAFHDTEHLWPVVLDEIAAQKWGERQCSLCDDPSMSRTGVCIKCDAGMCKSYFHVTCAQRHGLLTDPHKGDEEDPYLAYCKQHSDRAQITVRKRNFLAMFSSLRKAINEFSGDERLARKFNDARTRYQRRREHRTRPMSPKFKVAKTMSSCPSALSALMRKAKLAGRNSASFGGEAGYRRAGTVAFNVEFVAYYFERERKFSEACETLEKLREEQTRLKREHDELRRVYEAKLGDYEKINELKRLSELYEGLVDMCRTQKATKRMPKIEATMPIEIVRLNECWVCKATGDQHLIVSCDTCGKWYHIGCLEPPLSVLPKKTRLYGWQCSWCAHGDSDTDASGSEVDVNAPRALRNTARETKKAFNLSVGDVGERKRVRTRTEPQVTPAGSNIVKSGSAESLKAEKRQSVDRRRSWKDKPHCGLCERAFNKKSKIVKCDCCESVAHEHCARQGDANNKWKCNKCSGENS